MTMVMVRALASRHQHPALLDEDSVRSPTKQQLSLWGMVTTLLVTLLYSY